MNTTEQLARVFSRIVYEWLGESTMREVIASNESYKGTTYEGCCATGNHCDSNMAMDEAFHVVLGRGFTHSCDDEGNETPELLAKHEADSELWNTAWDMAKANRFWLK